MNLLVLCLVLVQPPAKDSKEPAFDLENLERTATYVTKWQAKLGTAWKQAQTTGNDAEYERLRKELTKELSQFVGEEVSWPARFMSLSGNTLTFDRQYIFKASKSAILVQYSPRDLISFGSEPQPIEDWMGKLKRGDLVMAKGRIQSVRPYSPDLQLEVRVDQVRISPMPTASKKK